VFVQICAVAITDRHIAFGCENGAIYFFASNDLIREKCVYNNNDNQKRRRISLFRRYKFAAPFFQAKQPITNLALVEGIKPRNHLIIYATTETSVRSFRLIQTPQTTTNTITTAAAAVGGSVISTLRDRRPFQLTAHHQLPPASFEITDLEIDIGCSTGCAVLTQSEFDGEQQFVIANSTGVLSYVGEDKRLGLPIEGEKLTIHWWFNYLITVTKESKKTPMMSTGISSSLHSLQRTQPTILNQLTAK